MRQRGEKNPRALAVRAVCWKAYLLCVGPAALACAFACAPVGSRDVQVTGAALASSSEDETIATWMASLTLEEKVAQLQVDAPAVPRLGLPGYGWWNEALHGLARQGTATVFPQAIGLAATFDPPLLEEIGGAIADEARLKDSLRHARDGRRADRAQDEGLTFFSPNVNLDRDPRWGRGQETYGEDPLLVGAMATAFVRGLQGEGAFLRAAGTAKHFAVHSGPEGLRHRFNAEAGEEDLGDSYLPAFEKVVREGHVAMVMAAYNAINGVPVAASRYWLTDVLRGQWGFAGVVVGDCGAVGDLVSGHHVAPDAAHAAALALKAGLDLDCGRTFGALREAVGLGLVEHADLDRALTRLSRLRWRLGLLGPAREAGAREAGTHEAGTHESGARDTAFAAMLERHRTLALRAARESLVLLENHGGLPLDLTRQRRILVVGPAADDQQVLLGNYHGTPRAPVTFWEGMAAEARARGLQITYAHGAGFTRAEPGEIARAVAAARAADVVVAVVGLSPRLEGEEGDPESDNPSGDRSELRLPRVQRALLGALAEAGRPVILVLTGGGALTYPRGPWLAAALLAWYPGQEGGRAVAEALFGLASPSGRLPITFYRSTSDLPPFENYRMTGRTYRFFQGSVAWPFGHGGDGGVSVLQASKDSAESCEVSVHNDQQRNEEELVQVYLVAPAVVRGQGQGEKALPFASLVGFSRLTLAPHEIRAVKMGVDASAVARFEARVHALLPEAALVYAVGFHAPSAAWVGNLGAALQPRPLVIPP